MSRTDSSPILAVDEQQHYRCEACPARCCRFPWGITITPEELRRYQQTSWIQEHLARFDTQFVPENGVYKLPRVQLQDGGTGCVFLDADNLCTMQKREGHEFIPVTCQTYPFGFYEAKATENAAKTVYPITSYFCKSILENYGDPLTGSMEARYARHQALRHVQVLPELMTLGILKLPQETYFAFGDWLSACFARQELSVPQALILARQLLQELLLTDASQQSISVADLNASIAQLPGGTEPDDFADEPHNLTGRVIVATRIMLSVQEYAALEHLPVWQRFIQEKLLLIRVIQEAGTIHLWDQPQPIDLQQARQVRLVWSEPFHAEMRRYFVHLADSRQMFTQTQNLLKILFLLAGNYSAILRLTRYLAFAQGCSEAAPEHLRAAIGYVDAAYGHQGQFDNIRFSAQEVILDLLATGEGAFARVLYCEPIDAA